MTDVDVEPIAADKDLKTKLKMVHKHYSPKPPKGSEPEMDIFHFFNLCKECNVVKLGVSYQQMVSSLAMIVSMTQSMQVQAFTMCNEDEIEAFLQCKMLPSQLQSDLSM